MAPRPPLRRKLGFSFIKQSMSTNQDAPRDLYLQQNLEFKPRLRSYQIKAKQKRSDLDDYDLKQTIGEGGFGKVKKAIHKLTGEVVAVKICSTDEYDPQNLTSIEREIQTQKNLLHQNIAQIYEVIRKESKIYIFMEYCKNGELYDKINQNGRLPQKEAAKIFSQILSALIYLKQNNLSHRDIKPENVLFDQQWNVKLIDFGFSCCFYPGQFRKTVCGTPSYTPPQIIKRTSYDAQLADVWSLGVTLYAMLAAKLPFQAESNQKRRANILSFKYANQPQISTKAQKLIASIFVDAKYRPRLADLKNSEFFMAYGTEQAHFINFKNEDLVIEEEVIDVIKKDYHEDAQKVVESVRSHRFDKYHALYYLTIKNQRHTHRHIQNNSKLDEFRKRRKNSLIKLQPINSRTPSVRRKSNSFKTTNFDKFIDLRVAQKEAVDANQSRLRKSSPDSPRRLLDCLAAYKAR